MTSKVELFNRVLLDFGFARIDDPDDPGYEATVLRELYPRARDEVLMARPGVGWACGIRRAELAQVVEENPLHNWDFVYQLPVQDKCLEVLALLDGRGQYMELDGALWVTEGERLYTTEPYVAIRYMARIEVKEMAPHVVQMLTSRLAMRAATPLKDSLQLRQMMEADYERIFLEAGAQETRLAQSRMASDRPRSKIMGGHGRQRFHRG